MAELAAIIATVLAAVAAIPQLRRVVVGADRRGVSLSAALLGVVNETVWIAYAADQRLWSALPEAVLMATSNGALVICLVRTGVGGGRRAGQAAIVWAAVLAATVVIGGTHALAVALGAAYAVQVAPAVWTAWRTPSPSGVAGATWAMVLVESALWGVYGLHHADPATTALGAVGIVAGAAMLVRKGTTRRQASIGVLVTTPVTSRPRPPVAPQGQRTMVSG